MNLYTLFIKCLLLFLASFLSATAHAEQVVVTSGRVEYDPFGRAVRVCHPTVDSERVDSFSRAVDNVAPTRTEYDELDRPLVVHLPDETVTTYEYSLVGNVLKTTVTDAEALTTTFAYDGIGRLTTVTDTEGNVTSSTYDLGDRRTSVTHPASGKATFTYDALGNVLTRQTANLRTQGQCISYTYEQGRLKRVSYPGHPENDVIYHYGDGNAEQGLCDRGTVLLSR